MEKVQRPPTPIQEVVEAYRQMREGAPTEGKPLQMFYSRNVATAKQLLEACGDDVEKAKSQVRATGAYWPARGMNWSLETAIKDALDPARLSDNQAKASINSLRKEYDDHPYKSMEGVKDEFRRKGLKI